MTTVLMIDTVHDTARNIPPGTPVDHIHRRLATLDGSDSHLGGTLDALRSPLIWEAMTGTDPAVGDRVILYGSIRSIDAGVALVEVYRTYPVGGTIAVQCGALELDERKFDSGTPHPLMA